MKIRPYSSSLGNLDSLKNQEKINFQSFQAQTHHKQLPSQKYSISQLINSPRFTLKVDKPYSPNLSVKKTNCRIERKFKLASDRQTKKAMRLIRQRVKKVVIEDKQDDFLWKRYDIPQSTYRHPQIGQVHLPRKSFNYVPYENELTTKYQINPIGIQGKISEQVSKIVVDGLKVPSQFDIQEIRRKAFTSLRHLAQLSSLNLYKPGIILPRKPYQFPETLSFLQNSKFNNIRVVRAQLQINPLLVHSFNTNYETATHWAAKRNNHQLILLLYNHGAFIDARDLGGRSPLYQAVRFNQQESIEVLLKLGANPYLTTYSGKPIQNENATIKYMLQHYKILRLKLFTQQICQFLFQNCVEFTTGFTTIHWTADAVLLFSVATTAILQQRLEFEQQFLQQWLLKSDQLQYRLIPVCNYTELHEEIKQLEDSQIRSVIFLNCGGACDLTQYWPNDPSIQLYVIDSCRPFWGSNITAQNVFIIEDDYAEIQEPLSEEESEEEGRRRRRDAPQTRPKRVRNNPDPSGLVFGLSTAGVIYRMANDMNKSTNLMLWMWIVGLTDQYVHLKIDKNIYEQRLLECQTEVRRTNSVPFAQSIRIEEIEGVNIETDNNEEGNIHIETNDLRLMLYRHWTLFDSMYYCSYIATRLGIWKEPGRQRLKELLAKIGIPLVQCRQFYKFMTANYKKTLKNKLRDISNQYHLDDLFLTTCVRQYSRKYQFSSFDVVYAVTAIIENPTCLQEREITDSALSVVDSREKWLENYWIAYEALVDADKCYQGIQLAIELQKSIFQLGKSILDRKAVTSTQTFRYSIINTDLMDQAKLFHHPLSLKKLSKFIMEAYRFIRSNTQELPMVMCIQNSSKNTYFISGITHSNNERNDFGYRFNEAVNAIDASCKRDFFEDSYIEVPQKDFIAFMEQLIEGSY